MVTAHLDLDSELSSALADSMTQFVDGERARRGLRPLTEVELTELARRVGRLVFPVIDRQEPELTKVVIQE
jgi:hypothetical protein